MSDMRRLLLEDFLSEKKRLQKVVMDLGRARIGEACGSGFLEWGECSDLGLTPEEEWSV